MAQEGGIAGTVTDETGAVVPGATVTLSGSDEGRVTQSDATGEYVFPAVSVGTDAVTAALSGFSAATKVGADPRRHQLTDGGAVAEVETLDEGRSRPPATLYRPGVTSTPNYIAQRRPGPIPGPIPGDTAYKYSEG